MVYYNNRELLLWGYAANLLNAPICYLYICSRFSSVEFFPSRHKFLKTGLWPLQKLLHRYYCANFSIRRAYGRISFMTQPSLPVPHENRKVERLLIALAKKKPVKAVPAPGTAHPRVFFST